MLAHRDRHLALGLLPLVLVACVATTGGPGADPRRDFTELRGSHARLTVHQPADVAVAPVRNRSGRKDVPLDLFRAEAAELLVERLYSSLALDYVDANWVESSFRGTPAPDALLVMAVTEWDPSRLYSSGTVRIAGDLVLYEGGDTTGEPLWGLSLRRYVELGSGGRPPSPSEHLIPEAIQRFVRDALAELPERDVTAAHRE